MFRDPTLCRRLAVLLALVGAMLPASSAAHAGLESSDPAANAIVAEPPDVIVMRFTEPLEWSGTTAELHDATGEIVTGTSVREGSDPYEMVLELPVDLPRGTYSVLWRTLSTADGHPAQNYFAFTVGTAANVTDASLDVVDGDQPPLWLQAIARWAALLGLAASVAIWPMWVLVIRPAASRVRQADQRLVSHAQRFAAVALIAAALGNLLALAVQAGMLPGGWWDAVWTTLTDTRYGGYWLLRIALLVALAATLRVAWWPAPGDRLGPSVVAMVLSASLVLPFSMVAHAAAQQEGRATAILTDALHLVGASLWAGGLLALLTIMPATLRRVPVIERRVSLSTALRRFSTLALAAWCVMVLTGIYSAWLHVGSREALLDTDYGRTLITKLALLVPALGLAMFNQRLAMPGLERFARHPTGIAAWYRRLVVAIAAEVALVILVLGTVGALTAQAPARDEIGDAGGAIEARLSGGELDATLVISPGTPGPNELHLTFDGEPPSHATDVLLRVASSERDTGEKELAFAHDGDGYRYAGSELSLPGVWALELIVRPPDAFEWRSSGTVTIETAESQGSTPSWVISGWGGWIAMLAMAAGLAGAVVWWRTRRANPPMHADSRQPQATPRPTDSR